MTHGGVFAHSKPSLLPTVARGGWYLALGLAVAGPLLGSGRLLLLDYTSGPSAFAQMLFPLPSSSNPGNGVPFLAVLRALAGVQTVLPDKLLLLAPVVLGGLGADRLLRRRFGVGTWPAVYAATLYAVNPFVRDRYLAGQLFFLLGYGLLPFALESALGRSGPAVASGARRGVWGAVLAAIDLHVALLYVLFVALFAVVRLPRARAVLVLGTAAVTGAALAAYWLLPWVFAPPTPAIARSDISTFASTPRGPAVFPALLSLHGFWRTEVVPLAFQEPVVLALLVPLVGLAILGAEQMLRQRGSTGTALVLIAAMVGAVVFAGIASISGLTGTAEWLFLNVPALEAFREPQKLVLLVVLGYAVFGAVMLEQVGRRRRLLVVLASGCVLGYGAGLFWGFNGTVSLSHYPDGWLRASRIVAHRPGPVLALPWHPYTALPFAGGRVIAQTGRSLFGPDTLEATGTGLAGAITTDPFQRYVGTTLLHRATQTHFGAALAPLGIRWVFLARVVDWSTYRFLTRQSDLRRVLTTPSAVLYENVAWRPGGALVLSAPATSHERRVAVRTGKGLERLLITAPPAVGFATANGSSALARLVQERSVPAAAAGAFISLPLRCTDGWRVSGSSGTCDLGAVAAFKAPAQMETAVRPADAFRLVGYVLSACAAFLALGAAAVHAVRPGHRSIVAADGGYAPPMTERR